MNYLCFPFLESFPMPDRFDKPYSSTSRKPGKQLTSTPKCPPARGLDFGEDISTIPGRGEMTMLSPVDDPLGFDTLDEAGSSNDSDYNLQDSLDDFSTTTKCPPNSKGGGLPDKYFHEELARPLTPGRFMEQEGIPDYLDSNLSNVIRAPMDNFATPLSFTDDDDDEPLPSREVSIRDL